MKAPTKSRKKWLPRERLDALIAQTKDSDEPRMNISMLELRDLVEEIHYRRYISRGIMAARFRKTR